MRLIFLKLSPLYSSDLQEYSGVTLTQDLYAQFTATLVAAIMVPALLYVALSIIHTKIQLWRWLAVSYLSLFLGGLLMSLRSIMPPEFSIVLGNYLVILAYVCYIQAIGYISQSKPYIFSKQYIFVFSILFFLPFFILYFKEATYAYRVAAISFPIAFISIASLILIQKIKTYFFSTTGYVLLLIAVTANICITTFRGISALAIVDHPLLSLTFWDPIFFIGTIAITVCLTVSFIMIGTSQITAETKMLLQREKEASQKLHSALEEQRELVNLMAHEIRRPISSTLDNIFAKHEKGEMREDMYLAIRNPLMRSITFLDAVNDSRDISNLISDPQKNKISMATLAADMKTKFNILTQLDDNTRALTFVADALLLEIAVDNLISNGQTFATNPEKVSLRISVGDGLVTFLIEDDGPGVPYECLDKIWEKFFTYSNHAPNKQKPSSHQGFGLGLYLVKCIAEIHGGSARVIHQQPSQFELQIPLVEAKA